MRANGDVKLHASRHDFPVVRTGCSSTLPNRSLHVGHFAGPDIIPIGRGADTRRRLSNLAGATWPRRASGIGALLAGTGREGSKGSDMIRWQCRR